MLTAHEVEPNSEKRNHRELVQKIYSHAQDFGFDKLIKHNQCHDAYTESCEFEEGDVRGFLDEFEEHNFWEALISNLAERDFLREIELRRFDKMSVDQKIEIISKHEEKWAD